MPKMQASKEDLEGGKALPEGMYTIALRGFKPKTSKKKDSTNLNPDLRVTNHPTLNDEKVFYSLNTNAPWIWMELCHAFGCPLEDDGSGNVSIPGNFDGPENDPSKWVYSGPLLNQEAQIKLVQKEYLGKMRNDIAMFVCRVAGCAEKHSDNLVKV